MITTAQQIFKELEQGKPRPLYLVVGEEPFQLGEILNRLRNHFVPDESARAFNYESYDGEEVEPQALLASLDTVSGLFSDDMSLRFVVCHRFDKISSSGLEILEKYLMNPSPTTVFFMQAAKVDKRKAWYKAMEQNGAIVEVSEPYDREWPKWHGYLERKVGKKIESAAWEMLVASSNRSLSLVWAELSKVALFVGEENTITKDSLSSLAQVPGGVDIFEFAEDVIARRNFAGMRKYQQLVHSGESEIKMLAILVRQFRQVEHCAQLLKQGVFDTKVISQQIGAHPFFVNKIINQAKQRTLGELGRVLDLLSDCDYRLKTGEGNLFQNFLIPYFQTRT